MRRWTSSRGGARSSSSWRASVGLVYGFRRGSVDAESVGVGAVRSDANGARGEVEGGAVDPVPRRVNARVFEPKQTTRVGSLARVEVNPPTSSRRLKNASPVVDKRRADCSMGESRAYRAGRAAGARRQHRERRDTRPIRPRRAAMPSRSRSGRLLERLVQGPGRERGCAGRARRRGVEEGGGESEGGAF